jgi:hypothetical protein
MLVSFSHGFYFLKPAKTAGTTIECVLGQLCQEKNDIFTKFRKSENIDNQYRQGKYQKSYSENFKEHTNYKELTQNLDVSELRPVIAIRHPYEICASECAWSGKGIEEYNKGNSIEKTSEEYLRSKFDSRFMQPLKYGFSDIILNKFHLEIYRQYEFYDKALEHSNLYTIRFSNLQEDLENLCEIYNISKNIPHTKKTGTYTAEKVSKIFSDKQLNLIHKFFKNDFDYWKWKK